jgi:glycosyltransferase involved in cell wall biosynthesis
MRILHVNKFLYRRGGAESYMLDVASLQRDAGHEVEFFGMRFPDNQPCRFERWFPERIDFEPPPPSLEGKVRGAGRLLWSTSAARGMEQVLRAFRPDLVHLHNIYHQLSPSILRPLGAAGTPTVMTLHDYKLACPTYRFLDHGRICEACVPRRFWNAAVRRCNGGSFAASALNSAEMMAHTFSRAYGPVHLFVCPSRFLEGKMRQSRVYPKRLRWNPNFVDVASAAAKRGPGRGVVYAGRLSHEKGVDVLIEAVALRPALDLDVAGDGPARPELERLVLARDVGDRVRFHGRLGPAELRDLLGAAAVSVVPSRWYENMPLAVLDAFAAGLPVVASTLGGLPELIEPGVDGLLVPPENADALADALADLTRSPEVAFEMGRAARAKAEARFAPERHMERLGSIYDEAVRVAGARERR